jgi:predicted RNase H-like nuclease (RuvC/YqgF family)
MNSDKKEIPNFLERIEEWQRIISNLRLENTNLKNLISQTMQLNQKFESLEQAEYFLNRFIQKDQVLDLFRQDVNMLHGLMVVEGTTADAGITKFNELNKDLERLLGEMENLKLSFAGFLSKNRNY